MKDGGMHDSPGVAGHRPPLTARDVARLANDQSTANDGKVSRPAELHAWVVAQWQAKLDVAWAATPGPWEALAQDSDGQNTVLSRGPGDGEKATGAFKAVWLEVQSHDGNWNINLDRQTADADHIAAFDPAFAVAVCESALRRLERHRPTFVVDEPPIIWYCVDQGDPWPCPEVLDDASPFAGQPDFPEELKRP